MKLTVCVTTSRPYPQIGWIEDSLKVVGMFDEVEELLVISAFDALLAPQFSSRPDKVRVAPVKPNIWQGEYRKTPVDWWAKSSAINTALCLCRSEWILFLDDRSVIQPGFKEAVQAAIAGNYIMAGAYEKRIGLKVEEGIITDWGELMAKDHRTGSPASCSGEWLFGCCVLAPLEWWLGINGSPEKCDGLGFEDVITGLLFANAGRPIKFDSRAKIIEDRSPEHIGTAMRRESKEKHPHDSGDKAHTLLRWVRSGADKSENSFNIRTLRHSIETGGEFPKPEDRDYHDWHDGQNLEEMV